MRLGIVSDTHGHRLFALEGVRLLQSLDVDVVLHCGDVGGAEIPNLFAAWPTHFVRGNVDRDRELAAAVAEAGQQYHGSFAALELGDKKIAVLHGDDERRLRETVACGQWDLVCHGHTHQAVVRREGETLVLNPGALYRATPHSVAYVELPALEATIVPV